MTTTARIAAVTGSNKGIGLACVRQLALQYPQSKYNDGPFLIYLTARNQDRGEAALREINDDPQLTSAKALRSHGGLTEIKFVMLDISSRTSVQTFAQHIKKEHPEGIDMLINNAGIALDGFDADVVRQTIDCNYYGTLEACRQLLPHIRDGGRVVNIASMSGHLNSKYSEGIRSRFLNARTVDDISELMEEYTSAVAKDNYQNDWPGAGYAVSKAGEIGMSRALAAELKASGSTILLNACCPGYVNTSMTKGRGVKTPDEGAKTPVLLALGDIQNAHGQFWQNEKAIEW